MTKADFLDELTSRLRSCAPDDAERIKEYCCELIDDRCEEGFSEEDAVAALGSVDDIIAEARESFSEPKKQKTGKRLSPAVIVLLITGSPVWVSLLIAFFAVVFSFYVTMWALCTPVYALCAAFASGGLTGVAAAFSALFAGAVYEGLMLLGASFLLLGLFALMLLASIYVTKGMTALTKWLFIAVKSIFTGKGK